MEILQQHSFLHETGSGKPHSFSEKAHRNSSGSCAAYDCDGAECARSCLVSAAGEIGLSVRPEETTVKAGDIVYVDIVVAGENGAVEANCDMPVTVTVENGTLLAFGSANPRTQERFETGTYTTYYGRAQAVVQTKKPGIVTVTAQDDRGFMAAAQVTV